ncbi:MAG: DUF4249 domain-containing protein [Flavobacteriaceae bacterium]|nr:DUF4249 domain-containing protein [Flavobacteriaceae bacterium]
MVKIILKITTFIVLLIAILFTLISCEDVIDVDLSTGKPKLVIDASLKWQKGTAGNEQTIILSTTAGFYEENVPAATGATVFVTNGNNDVFNFIEIPNTGEYFCDNFVPEIDQNYTLTVIYNGETYTANETLIAVPPINGVVQDNNGGFTGNQIEVRFFYDDIPNLDNYYLIQFNTSITFLPEYDVISDEFFQNNQMFGLYTNEDLNANDNVTLTLQGISESYYNYMNILLGIAGSNGGSPFQTPPATVRGNIINQTNFENYALGFFRLSEIDSMQYTVE